MIVSKHNGQYTFIHHKGKFFSKAEKEGGHYQIDSHSIIDAGIVKDRWSDYSLLSIVEIIIFKSGEKARVIDFMIYLKLQEN